MGFLFFLSYTLSSFFVVVIIVMATIVIFVVLVVNVLVVLVVLVVRFLNVEIKVAGNVIVIVAFLSVGVIVFWRISDKRRLFLHFPPLLTKTESWPVL